VTTAVGHVGGEGAGRSLLSRLRRRAIAGRVPLAGTIELTTRCNLRCVHCYQGAQRHRMPAGAEMSKETLFRLVDESVGAGCLDVLLTGGEPLLRKDFGEIYRHVKSSGVFVTVFTNGTLLTNDHVALFRELPPVIVEVSLYGATAATYESVTGVPGSFERCVAGVDRLRDGGVSTALKTVVLKGNQHEVAAMEASARDLGMKFRMDPVICPGLDGDPAPLAERADPAIAARLQFGDPVKRQKFAEYLALAERTLPAETTYRCDAGVVAYYLTASGGLRGCVMMSDREVDAAAVGFGPAWESLSRFIGDPKWVVGSRCQACPDLAHCGYCPALLRLEQGRADSSSDYLCETGRARRAEVSGQSSKIGIEEGEAA
jgi:radical SAM protein with 4Fe4S-binding SPASM domain